MVRFFLPDWSPSMFPCFRYSAYCLLTFWILWKARYLLYLYEHILIVCLNTQNALDVLQCRVVFPWSWGCEWKKIAVVLNNYLCESGGRCPDLTVFYFQRQHSYSYTFFMNKHNQFLSQLVLSLKMLKSWPFHSICVCVILTITAVTDVQNAFTAINLTIVQSWPWIWMWSAWRITPQKGRINSNDDNLTLREKAFIALKTVTSPLTPPIFNDFLTILLFSFFFLLHLLLFIISSLHCFLQALFL